jgi:hypothetical protein
VTFGPTFRGFGSFNSLTQRQTVGLLISNKAATVLSETSAQSGKSSNFVMSAISDPQIKKPAFAGLVGKKIPPFGGCWLNILDEKKPPFGGFTFL